MVLLRIAKVSESLTPGFRISLIFPCSACHLLELFNRRISVELCGSTSRHELLNILDHFSSQISDDEVLVYVSHDRSSHPTRQGDAGWAPFSTHLRRFHCLSPRLSIAIFRRLDALSSLKLVHPLSLSLSLLRVMFAPRCHRLGQSCNLIVVLRRFFAKTSNFLDYHQRISVTSLHQSIQSLQDCCSWWREVFELVLELASELVLSLLGLSCSIDCSSSENGSWAELSLTLERQIWLSSPPSSTSVLSQQPHNSGQRTQGGNRDSSDQFIAEICKKILIRKIVMMITRPSSSLYTRL